MWAKIHSPLPFFWGSFIAVFFSLTFQNGWLPLSVLHGIACNNETITGLASFTLALSKNTNSCSARCFFLPNVISSQGISIS
jgi:hypothetical protein